VTLPDGVRALLQDKVFAHLALVDERGVPTVTPVWIDVDDDDLIIVNTAEGRVKARLLQVGARIALSALDPASGYRYVAVNGTVVERTHEGALEQIDALCRKYHDGRAWVARPGEQRVTVRIRADRATLHG
jgi:PPOX class probable F420-dependent enzyme